MPRQGFSLIESILSIALFLLFIIPISATLFLTYQQGEQSIARGSALLLAQEGIEAVTHIRNYHEEGISEGTFGLHTQNNTWILQKNAEYIDAYERRISIDEIDEDRQHIRSEILWTNKKEGLQSLSLETILTDWQPQPEPPPEINTCEQFCTYKGYEDGGTCRKKEKQCLRNDEIYESEGDQYCTEKKKKIYCCCEEE